MQKFEVAYSLQGKIVLVLIVIPLLWTIPLFVAVTLIPDMPQWMILLLVCLILLGAIISTLRLVNRKLNVPSQVTMDENKIEVKLLASSFLYTITHYESNWQNIKNVSSNIDTQNNKRFYQVQFRNPSKTITLTPGEEIKSVDEETAFGKALMGFVNKYNSSPANPASFKIHNKGFYESGWAKLLTAFAWLMTALVIIAKLSNPDGVSIWKVLGFLAYCAMWLTAYYANRKK